jgi:long-subunit fatty acid transport protein
MKRTLVITGLVLLTQFLLAQFPEDALRFSQIYWQGTARSMGAGSAFAGLGADFLTASTNPGGMGVFRSKDLSVSPEIFSRKVNSTYYGNPTSANRTTFAFSNIGYVIAKPIKKGGRGWKFYQISFGVNRLNNYNSEVFMEGYNPDNSRMDVYLEETFDMLDQGFGLEEINDYDPFYLGPAWDTYLLDTVRQGEDLFLVSPVPPGGMVQSQQITTRGSNNEFLASFSGNFNDVLYIGATLAFPYIRYYRESVYTETDVDNSSDTFDQWSITENLSTTGWGINFKIGAIVRPADWMRIGASFHTPSYYFTMRDNWSTNTFSNVYSLSGDFWFQGNAQSVDGEFRYRLTTPLRLIGSLGFIIKEIGFITGEYEYADYASSKFGASDYGFNPENEAINNIFLATHNLRFGTEWRVNKLSLRAGYAIYPSPYADNLNDGARTSFTGGIGYRAEKVAIEFAYVRSVENLDYYMYSYANPDLDIYIQPESVANEIISQNFVFSLRYFFQ